MTWLVPYFIFFAGLIEPGGALDGIDNLQLQTKMTTGIELFGVLNIEGTADIYSLFPDDSYFQPYQGNYEFRTYIAIKGFSLGYEHQCFHPISPGAPVLSYYGGFDRIYIEYSTRR